MTAPSASTTSTVPAGFSGAPGTDDFPVRLGSPESFAAVRRLFEAADFHETSVARRLGGTQLFGFPRLCDGRKQLAGPPSDANAVLIRLLLDGEPLPAATARALCGDAGIDALCALGVLVPEPSEPEALRATLMLAPVRGLWLASDASRARTRRPDPALERRDFVFPPLSELTREFLDVLPVRPGARALELCAGSGVAAHLLARGGVAEAWATDITARSVHYTRFNAALNELPAIVAVESDAWQALAGETFDLVVAHPPYVPALAHEFDYRDGGADGARIARAIVQGLPAHLRPGGVCAITCAFGESRAEPAEARVRAWLGDAAPEFDLVVLQRRDWDGLRMYRSVVPQEAARDYQDAERWLRHFAALGVEGFAHVSFELRRTAAGRAPITERRMAGPVTSAAAFDWQFAWAEHRAATHAGDATARMAGHRPRVAPGATLHLALVADADGSWRTAGGRAEVEWPAKAAVRVPPLAPTLLELCDGTRDAGAIHAALDEAGLLDEDVTHEQVARMLELLLSAGALEIAACPLPPHPEPMSVSGPPDADQTTTTDTSSVPMQSSRQ
jgi:methylase of polypeptide subunit release factors